MKSHLYVAAILFIAAVYLAGTNVARAQQSDIARAQQSDIAGAAHPKSLIPIPPTRIPPTRAEVRYLILHGDSGIHTAGGIRTTCKNSDQQALVCGSSMLIGGVAAASWGFWKLNPFASWTPYEGPPGVYVTAGITLGGFILAVWGIHLIQYAIDFPPERFGRRVR